ncbi:MAG: C40 family peptidase [Actinobacteria bacterium]|nr:C40 family peptidase [Actinomycetota bacterium]
MRAPRTIRFCLGIAIALFGGAVSIEPVAADGISNQQAEVKRVLAEIDALEQKEGQFAELGVQALDLKSQLDAEIVVSQGKIAAQQAELNVLGGQLSNVAVQKVMGGGSGALGPLFTDPTAIDEGLQRDHLARVAVNAGAATTDDFEALLRALDKEQRSLTKKQAKATDLAANAEINRKAADKAGREATTRLAKAKVKLGSLIEQERQRQAAAAKRQYQQKLQQQQAAAAARKGSGKSGSGAFGGGASLGSGGGGSYVAVSGQAGAAIRAAQSQLGVPYRFASSTPGVAFDCSGLTAWAWGTAGVSLPHQSRNQYSSVPHVSASDAQPGDLIFYYSPISHVGIYLGGGMMIHSPQTGTSVSYTQVHWDKVVGVGRPG